AGRTRRCQALLLGPLGRVPGLALLALGRRRHAPARLLAAAREVAHARHARHTAATCHLLHHLLRTGEPFEQLVDVRGGGARTAGDPRAARAVDDLGAGALGRGHRAHDRLDAVDLTLVEVLDRLTHLAHARQHAE